MQKKVKLGEIGQLKNGLNFAKKDVKNKCKIIGVADFANNTFPEYGLLDAIDESLVSDDFLLKDGDIIFVRSNGNKALVGRTMFIENICEKICYSGFCIRFRPDIDKVNPQYLFYLLRSPMVRKQYSYSQQTNITNLSQDVLSGVTLFLPDIEIQNKQAKILHDLDMKILSNTMINDNLEQQAMMLYNQWFTQFDFPDQDGKPYKSTGNKMVCNSLIKINIPEGWNVLKLSNVIENICTGLNPRENFVLGNGNIRYVTVKNLTTSGTLDFSGCDTIDQQARNIVHNRSHISTGDILFASIAPLGRCYLILDEPRDWDINESVFSIRANKKFLTPDYLYMYFMSDSFIKGATSSSTGSIFKGIRIGTLQDTLAVIPPLEIVDAFTKKVHQLLVLKSKTTMESEQLVQLRDWLLPMLMNGQATIQD